MIQVATIVCIAVVRAVIAATLGYAVLPVRWFIVVAAGMDAAFGVAMGRMAVRGLRPPRRMVALETMLRVLLLVFAKAGDLGRSSNWPAGSLGLLLVWLAPIAIARIAIVPFVEPWRTERLHLDERVRQTLLAMGVTGWVTAAAVARLLRTQSVTIAAVASAVVATAFLAAGIVGGARRRRWLAAVRRGEVATHRLEAIDPTTPELPTLDEAPDAVVIATESLPTFRSSHEAVARVRALGPRTWPQVRRLAGFSMAAAVVTLGFDFACWNGSGWIPLRHKYDDRLARPHYMSRARLMEWRAVYDPPYTLHWRIDDARLESEREGFARVSAYEHPRNLAKFVPPGTCAEAGVIERVNHTYGAWPRSLAERAVIADPVKRDGRLLYTFRRTDGHFVRASVSLDGANATCIVDPPPIDDGAPTPLIGVRRLALGASRSCARTDGGIACWGQVASYFSPTQSSVAKALPEVAAASGEIGVGDGFACHASNGGVVCNGPSAPFASVPDVKRFFAGGTAVAVVDASGDVRVSSSSTSMIPALGLLQDTYVRSVALAANRACALLGDESLRCWGSNAPALDNETNVAEIALGSSLACFRRKTNNTVWCASGHARADLVQGLPPAIHLDVGDTHACAVDADGGVWCWGSNTFGELGDGTKVARTQPVRVLSDAVSVATSSSHSCAIMRDGRARCWGANADGQLGDGTFVDRLTPTEVIR